MPRRRNQAYHNKPLKKVRLHFDERSNQSKCSMQTTAMQPLNRVGFRSQLQGVLSQSQKTTHDKLRSYKSRTPRLQRLRQLLKAVVSTSVFLSLVAEIAGFYIINSEGTDCCGVFSNSTLEVILMYTGLVVASLLQIPLICAYWSLSLRYLELGRATFRLGRGHIPKLSSSPRNLLLCIVECLYNMIILVPFTLTCLTISFSEGSTRICQDDILYLLILMRSYHLLRLFFWTSRFSEMRVSLYTKVAMVTNNHGFIYRCWLAAYGHKLVLCIYGATIAFPGLAKFVLEKKGSRGSFTSLWNELWVVAYTQSTIGYGDQPPVSPLGRFTIITSCFAGIFVLGLLNATSSNNLLLSLPETTMCSELIVGRLRARQCNPVVLLLQSWWRLMMTRRRKTPNGPVIVTFYSRLGKFRRVLAATARVQYGRFEYQIQAFGDSVHLKMRRANEYFMPILQSSSLTLDIMRTEYHINQKTKDLKRSFGCGKKKLLALPRGIIDDDSSDRAISIHSATTPTLVRAKNGAFQRLKNRLIHFTSDQTPVSQ